MNKAQIRRLARIQSRPFELRQSFKKHGANSAVGNVRKSRQLYRRTFKPDVIAATKNLRKQPVATPSEQKRKPQHAGLIVLGRFSILHHPSAGARFYVPGTIAPGKKFRFDKESKQQYEVQVSGALVLIASE